MGYSMERIIREERKMKKGKYLIVDQSILPDYYEKVIRARELVESGTAKDVSQAVKMAGISRSTYYKYKDYVFEPGADSMGKKAVIGFHLTHKTGALAEALQTLCALGANILTINQNLPIGGKAHVLVAVDTMGMAESTDGVVRALSALTGVSGVRLVAVE